jgi:hypothetical protein
MASFLKPKLKGILQIQINASDFMTTEEDSATASKNRS